jgi:eukaryotic-like serine/threonine-protein kinase
MSALSLTCGHILGHYRILEQIGSGGMGIVFRAHDERLDRNVAIKVLQPGVLADESARKRFRREALALAKLNHPNIATIHDFDSDSGMDFLVMEYVCGTTLADKLQSGALPEKQILPIAEQITKALESAHSMGMVHRDLKPSNVMVTEAGAVKVLDFGLSVLLKKPTETSLAETKTAGHILVGTLPYMAPEQLRGEPLDGRCDLYAAGVLLYELATGHRPFGSLLSTNLIDDILHKPPASPQTINPRISAGLAEIILKCLEKEPEDRYQSAKEMNVDLRRMGKSSSFAGHIVRPPRRSRWPAALILSFVVVLAFTLVYAFVAARHRARLAGPTPPKHIASLAVLPLDNLSAEPAQEYFSDGLTEELIGALAKIGTLRVISRTSVMQYKGVHKPLPEIARELRVDGIVSGSVAHMADSKKVRITAELVDAATDRNLWAQSYERELGDVFFLQDEVARNIASQIRVQLTQQEQQRLGGARKVSPDAHDAYLKGRHSWSLGTEADLRQAKTYFEQAAKIDPDYAPAYAGLADYYWVTDDLPPRVAKSHARDNVLRALSLDDGLADAHTTFGGIKFYGDWDWVGSEKEFKRAIELNASNANAHEIYSVFLSAMGRHDEAIAEIMTAQEVDPVSLDPRMIAGRIFYYARQYDRALEQCRKALEIDPHSISAHDCLGEAYLGKKDATKAISEFRLVAEATNNDAVRLADLGRAYASARKAGEADATLAKLSAASKAHYVPPYFFAIVHAALGDNNKAFSWLEKAYDAHDSYLARLAIDPAMDPLRADPRFEKLLHRMRLARWSDSSTT